MSGPGTLSAALAYLPNWWLETTDAGAFDALLVGWVRACGWRAAGFIWPAEANPVAKTAIGATVAQDRVPPPEVPEVARRVRAGEQTVLHQTLAGGSRIYAPVMPAGRPLGLLWAEKTAAQPWTDPERAYLTLTAKTVERAPALAAVIGSVLDPDRLGERLADAAVIASRMAHEFNNILNGVIGFADLTLPLLPPGSQQAGWVAEIAKVGQRGTVFTQQLHQFGRSGQPRPTPGSVAGALMREEARLRAAMHPALKFEKDLPPNMPGVALESTPLQALLGHLLENAIEACPQGGTIRITARPVELSEADARGFLGKATAGPHLLVVVSDTGSGIKPDVRGRLFADPFFTTKIRHRGLGLAIVYRTLAAHRGGIQFEPVVAPGTGTHVRIVLPLAAARPAALTTTPMPAGTTGQDGSRRAGGTVNITTVGG